MTFRFLLQTAAVALLAIGNASAQSFSWRMASYGVESEEAGVARQSLAFDGNGGLYAFEYIAAVDGVRARVGRYVVANGNRIWQTDVPASAELPGYIGIGFDPASAALARAGDDVAVASTTRGSAFEGQVTKLKGSDGSVLWRSTDAGAFAVGYDAITVDANGDIVAAGSRAIDSGYAVSGRVGKYRGSDGGVLWQVSVDPASCGGGATFTLTAAAVDTTGDVFVAGASMYSNSGQTAAFCVIRLAGDKGNVRWSAGFAPASGVVMSGPSVLALDDNGNALVFGNYWPLGGSGSGVGALAKFDAGTGNVVWSKDGLPSGIGFLIVDPSGNALLSSYGTQKYAAADGRPIWATAAPVSGALALDENGRLLIAQNDGTDPYVTSGRKMDFFALDPVGGAQLWTSSLPLDTVPYWDGTEVIAVDGAGHFAALQAISHFCCELDQALLAVGGTNDGGIQWQASDRGFGPSNAYLLADVEPMFNNKTTMLAPDGNIVAVGMAYLGDVGSYFAGISGRITTMKRSSHDGHLLWRAVADAGLDRCEPASIAVDANGDVVVGGHCDEMPVTIKYRGSDGAQLWMGVALDTCKRAGVYAVGADAIGDVYATGWCDEAGTQEQLTVKYAGDSGTVRWARHTEGESTGMGGSPMYLTVAGNNIAVSSNLPLTGNFTRLVVSSLRTSDGAVQWSQHFDPPANSSYRANALAAFANGDLFASGTYGAWRLYASTGNIRWTNSTIGYVSALIEDPNDDLYFVGGDSVGKLHGNSGVPAWVTHDDAGGRGTILNDVALAANGAVLVTGSAQGNYLNLHVASFDGTTGAHGWSVTDTAVIYDVGIGIVPAPDGGAFVTADYANGDSVTPWTFVRVNAPGADSIFINGWEE